MKILFLGDVVGNSGTNAIKKNLASIIKENNIELVVGGAVSYDARENLRKFQSVHLTRFETRNNY